MPQRVGLIRDLGSRLRLLTEVIMNPVLGFTGMGTICGVHRCPVLVLHQQDPPAVQMLSFHPLSIVVR